MREEILRLKKEKNALILVHYYQTMDIQEIADFVCDSFEMATRAAKASEELLIICGVHFMAESAKILNPEKTVLLPNLDAGCPMADMIRPEDVLRLRAKYPKAAIVCYVNTSAAVKAVCDICCTSSSAEKIVRALPEKQIVFVPDKNLGAYVASLVPEKEIILFEGCCPIHHCMSVRDVSEAKKRHPKAKLYAHPECRAEVLKEADYIGSTAGIIKQALESADREIIIGTEIGVVERLKTLTAEKEFYTLTDSLVCPNMKKTRLADVLDVLEHGKNEITLPMDVLEAARGALERMVELG